MLSDSEGSFDKSCGTVEKDDDVGVSRVHSTKPSISGLEVATVKKRLFECEDEVIDRVNSPKPGTSGLGVTAVKKRLF